MLRLKIDGRWEPQDFIEVLQAVEAIYYKVVVTDVSSRFYLPFEIVPRDHASFEERLKSTNDWLLTEARYRAPSWDRIQVKAIIYASPGEIDLVGVGKAMEAIERIFGRLLDFFQERNKRREQDKQAAIDTAIKGIQKDKEFESLRALQIQNAREILALRKDYPGDLQEALIPLVVHDQEKIVPRIAEQKLIGVERPTDTD